MARATRRSAICRTPTAFWPARSAPAIMSRFAMPLQRTSAAPASNERAQVAAHQLDRQARPRCGRTLDAGDEPRRQPLDRVGAGLVVRLASCEYQEIVSGAEWMERDVRDREILRRPAAWERTTAVSTRGCGRTAASACAAASRSSRGLPSSRPSMTTAVSAARITRVGRRRDRPRATWPARAGGRRPPAAPRPARSRRRRPAGP